jgi:hypothetical protein
MAKRRVENQIGNLIPNDALPSPKLDPRWALVSKIVELWGLVNGMVFKQKRILLFVGMNMDYLLGS